MRDEPKKLRVVCDTNVLLSLFGFPGRKIDLLWEIVQEGQIELFLSEFILEELSRNLRKKVGLGSEEVLETIRLLKNHAQIISPKEKVAVIREKEADNRILECALEANAQVLVTGNFKHIRPLGSFRGIEILTPREFLDKYFN
ncbi:MAG: putative toxin-antitoxin system toxin component, PIN family [Candidatus Omnitrophica bacterium]|nr:putative toxin-antitoxin system toxin component, PIN family [Candidatus Omnitrophota bacterium]